MDPRTGEVFAYAQREAELEAARSAGELEQVDRLEAQLARSVPISDAAARRITAGERALRREAGRRRRNARRRNRRPNR
jgi:hypothetical protein